MPGDIQQPVAHGIADLGLYAADVSDRRDVIVVEAVPEACLSRECVIGGNAPVTLSFLITDYLRHLEHHLDQIFG